MLCPAKLGVCENREKHVFHRDQKHTLHECVGHRVLGTLRHAGVWVPCKPIAVSTDSGT